MLPYGGNRSPSGFYHRLCSRQYRRRRSHIAPRRVIQATMPFDYNATRLQLLAVDLRVQRLFHSRPVEILAVIETVSAENPHAEVWASPTRIEPEIPTRGTIMKSNLATAPVGKNVCQVAQNVCLKMYVKTRPGTGTHRMCMSPGMYIRYILY